MTQIIEEIREAIRRDCYRPLTEQMQRWLPVIEAMEKDAARYRWLSDKIDHALDEGWFVNGMPYWPSGDIDKDVDAAMERSK